MQSLSVTDASRPVLWESTTAGVSPRANHTFKDLPTGSFVSIRIRAVGAKGAGPGCDPSSPASPDPDPRPGLPAP